MKELVTILYNSSWKIFFTVYGCLYRSSPTIFCQLKFCDWIEILVKLRKLTGQTTKYEKLNMWNSFSIVVKDILKDILLKTISANSTLQKKSRKQLYPPKNVPQMLTNWCRKNCWSILGMPGFCLFHMPFQITQGQTFSCIH